MSAEYAAAEAGWMVRAASTRVILSCADSDELASRSITHSLHAARRRPQAQRPQSRIESACAWRSALVRLPATGIDTRRTQLNQKEQHTTECTADMPGAVRCVVALVE